MAKYEGKMKTTDKHVKKKRLTNVKGLQITVGYRINRQDKISEIAFLYVLGGIVN